MWLEDSSVLTRAVAPDRDARFPSARALARALEEVTLRETPVELLVGNEVVVDAVDLAGPSSARRRGDRKRELGKEVEDPLDQGALAGTRLTRDDEDGQRLSG
jgi:hypothetical protein